MTGDAAKSLALRGRVQIVVSAFLFSLTGVFVKLIPADGWTIIVLRGCFAMVFFGSALWLRGAIKAELLAFKASAWAATLCAAVSGTTFILAFKYTSVANVALIYATTPFVAALIAWLWFRERPRKVIMLAGLASLGGVAIIMQDSSGRGNLIGDLMALTMTLAMACYLCIYRKHPETPNTIPIILANILPLFLTVGFGVTVSFYLTDLPLIALFSVTFCAAAYLLAEGSKRISTSESALLSALETPLAPCLAFILLGSQPSNTILLGGAIIVFSSSVALSIRR